MEKSVVGAQEAQGMPSDPQEVREESSSMGGGPTFEPLEAAEVGLEEPAFEELPRMEEPVSFTGEEIARGVVWAAALGLRFQSPEEKQAFEQAFMTALPLPPPAVLDALGVGEALAAYGIHKGALLDEDGIRRLPPWLRIVIGVGYVGAAAFMAARAARGVRGERETGPSAGAGPVGAGLRSEEGGHGAGPVEATAPA